jgi:CubicO group peptidase (beta-lactamase class C family)
MRNFRSFSLLLVAAFATAQTQTPAPSSAPTLEQAVNAIRAYAPKALAEQGAPGMSVTITNGKETIAIISTGLADVATNSPVTPDTRFPIGSITKSMTTLALLQLHDAGLVDLNARVQRYLPSFAIDSHGAPILVRELLSHTAGIPQDYTNVSSPGYSIAALREAHTLFEPGRSWSYSNDGFETVGAIVAAVSKSTWQHEILSRVFGPIGMTASSAYFTPRTLERAATGYIFRDSDRVAIPPHPALIPVQRIDFVNAAGSVIAAPRDMAAYMRFYINGGRTHGGQQLISPASFEAMTTPAHLADGKLAGPAGPLLAEWPALFEHYGYGMGISASEDGDHLIAHTGGISGYTACMQIDLTRGFGVTAMSNLVEAPLHPCAIVKYAMAVLRAQRMGDPLPAPPAGPPIAAPRPVAADYAGSYTQTDSGVSVASDENGMYLRDGGKRYQLVEQHPDLFWTDDPRFTRYYVAFERNAARVVDGFTAGGTFYTNAHYAGPHTFAHPASWDRVSGRYDMAVGDGTYQTVRIVIVKSRLTVDGTQPLAPARDGTFTANGSTIRFDTVFDGKTQRMWIDGAVAYRMDLP